MSGEYCISCTCDLEPHLDADPNGDMGCVCARCRAEEEHDFDAEPNVEFDRAGRRIEPKEPEPESRVERMLREERDITRSQMADELRAKFSHCEYISRMELMEAILKAEKAER